MIKAVELDFETYKPFKIIQEVLNSEPELMLSSYHRLGELVNWFILLIMLGFGKAVGPKIKLKDTLIAEFQAIELRPSRNAWKQLVLHGLT